MTAWWRGPAGLSFRQCLRRSTAPTAIATAVAVAAHALSKPEFLDGQSASAASPWLTLPLFVAALACCLSAAHAWPTFALRRSGADTVRRLERGLLGGRGAVIAGALLAQLLLCAPLVVTLSWWFDAPTMARKHYPVAGPEYPVLDHQGASITFHLPSDAVVEAIWLRPRAALPTGPGDTEVALTANGVDLATTPVTFSFSLELLRVAIKPRQLSQFELTQTAGNVPLFFGEGGVTAVGPANLATWQNGLLVALLATWTSAITLILAAMIGMGTGWPTLATSIGCAQFVQWIGGIGPIDEAVLSLLRGQWLL